jgi:hypothetical protein
MPVEDRWPLRRSLVGRTLQQEGSWRVQDEQDLGAFGRVTLNRMSGRSSDGDERRPVRDRAAGSGCSGGVQAAGNG